MKSDDEGEISMKRREYTIRRKEKRKRKWSQGTPWVLSMHSINCTTHVKL